jgi:putative endonuclease
LNDPARRRRIGSISAPFRHITRGDFRTRAGDTHPVAPPSKALSSSRLGAAAETRAAEFLQARGLTILERNLRCKAGELDLVCLDGDVLVIVEVRLRTRDDFGGAPATVTARKQRRLIRATGFFWQRERDWRRRILRFDVVALGNTPDIAWIKDAFRAGR